MSPLAWFDPRGRLSRRAYGRLVIRVAFGSVTLLCVAVGLGARGWRDAAFAIIGGIAMLWLASLAQTVRRLHDRGRTGWWLSLGLALTALRFVPMEKLADAYPLLVLAYALATLAGTLWLLVETLGRRGTQGPNRFGPEPIAPDHPGARMASRR